MITSSRENHQTLCNNGQTKTKKNSYTDLPDFFEFIRNDSEFMNYFSSFEFARKEMVENQQQVGKHH